LFSDIIVRYQEAYELIDAGLMKANLSFPVLEALKAEVFDEKVNEVGLRSVKKRSSESFTSTSTNVYTFSNDDISNKIYKVQLDKSIVPFVSEKRYIENLDENLVDEIGYFIKKEGNDTKIYFTKDTDAGKSLKVFYYAKPTAKSAVTSVVDIPAQLIPACVHYALSQFLAFDGQMQIASGHRGLARQIEAEYIETDNAREAKPDIIPLPLQDFI